MKIIEVRGIGCTFDETALVDLDVCDWLGELEEGNPFHLKKLMQALFGESCASVMDSLRVDGRVNVGNAAEFVAAAIQEAGQGE